MKWILITLLIMITTIDAKNHNAKEITITFNNESKMVFKKPTYSWNSDSIVFIHSKGSTLVYTHEIQSINIEKEE